MGGRYEWVNFDYYEDGKYIEGQSRNFSNFFPSVSLGSEIGGDGSTDSSLKILEKYALKNSRIIIVNQENKGLSGARNIGVEKAIGGLSLT